MGGGPGLLGIMVDGNDYDGDFSEEKICFVISPIGHAGTPQRKNADNFLKYIVEKALEGTTFTAVRADNIPDPGKVTTQIMRMLVDAPLVIADLTDHNPNVMYELAIRHAVTKPFIQLITEGQRLPFDVGEQRTIFYDLTDPANVEAAQKALTAQVEAVMRPEFELETPLGRLVEVNNIVKEGPTQEVLARILARLDSLESNMTASSIANKAGESFGEGANALYRSAEDEAMNLEGALRTLLREHPNGISRSQLSNMIHSGPIKGALFGGLKGALLVLSRMPDVTSENGLFRIRTD